MTAFDSYYIPCHCYAGIIAILPTFFFANTKVTAINSWQRIYRQYGAQIKKENDSTNITVKRSSCIDYSSRSLHLCLPLQAQRAQKKQKNPVTACKSDWSDETALLLCVTFCLVSTDAKFGERCYTCSQWYSLTGEWPSLQAMI